MLYSNASELGVIDGDGLSLLKLKEGSEVDCELLDIELAASGKRICSSFAFFLLSLRDYSVEIMRDKLSELPVSEEAVNGTLKMLTEYGYINDEALSMRIAENYVTSGFGPIRIQQELMRRKFSRILCEECVNALRLKYDFSLYALSTLNKKLGDREVDYPLKQKMTAFLARRGFSYEEISSAWNKRRNSD